MDLNGSKVNLTDLQSMLNCPVCKKMMRPHIFQCGNGHAVCKDCSPKCESCPTCRNTSMGIRCLFAEQISTKLRHTCTYADAGCKVKHYVEQLQDHEKLCPYRPFECPCYDDLGRECNWSEPLLKFEDHVHSQHDTVWETGTGKIFKITYTSSNKSKANKINEYLLLAFEKLFWVRSFFDRNNREYLLSVQHVGVASDTEKFEYSVTCISPNNKMKLSFQTEVHSFAEDNSDIFKSKCCYVMPYDLMNEYSKWSDFEVKVEIKEIL